MLGHPLEVLRGAPRIRVAQALEHHDRARQIAATAAQALEREEAVHVARLDLDDALEHALRVVLPRRAATAVRLREEAPGLRVRRIGGEALLELRAARVERGEPGGPRAFAC